MEYDADATAQIRNVAAAQRTQVESRDGALAREQRDFGIEGFQQGAFPASHAADQVDEFAGAHIQIDIRKHHFAFAQQAFG